MIHKAFVLRMNHDFLTEDRVDDVEADEYGVS